MTAFGTISGLEDLPKELKMHLLHHMPNVSTLSALVHASPSYHDVYIALREELFTAATLQELSERNLDILMPCSFVEVQVRGNGEPKTELEFAIESLWDQTMDRVLKQVDPAEAGVEGIASDLVVMVRKTPEPKLTVHGIPAQLVILDGVVCQQSPPDIHCIDGDKIKLTIKDCLALLTIEDFVGWRFMFAKNSLNNKLYQCDRLEGLLDRAHHNLIVFGHRSFISRRMLEYEAKAILLHARTAQGEQEARKVKQLLEDQQMFLMMNGNRVREMDWAE